MELSSAKGWSSPRDGRGHNRRTSHLPRKAPLTSEPVIFLASSHFGGSIQSLSLADAGVMDELTQSVQALEICD